jgi:hypothetical protein
VISDSAEGMEETFRPSGWRDEARMFYEQRRSVWLVLAVMIAMSAFWTNTWAYVAFFAVLALYSAVQGVRIGFVCGASFALWFFLGHMGWIEPGSTLNRIFGLWAIASLFLLVVWKAGEKNRLRAYQRGED